MESHSEMELKTKLYQKIFAVMEAVDYVKKDGEVKLSDTYKYATDAAIKRAVHSALVQNRLLFLPKSSQIVEQAAETVTDKYGKPKREFRSTIELFYEFIDIDTGYSKPASIHGAGSGSDEKSIYKAFTGAFKYIFHLSLVIPTGEDPEKEELSKEEKKQVKEDAHAEQQAIAKRKIAQLEAGTLEPNWDWRIALPRYESYVTRFGEAETKAALQLAGYPSLEKTPNAKAAELALDEVKRILIAARNSTKTAAAEPQRAKPESKLEHAAAPLEALMKQVLHGTFKTRFDAIQKQKEELLEKYGPRDGERRYFQILDEHGGHIDTHANEIAKSGPQSEAVARDLWLELHPEAVEEVTA